MARVVLTEPAEYDLLEIEYYITVNLCNPQAAKRTTDGIMRIIKSLEYCPNRQPLVNDEYLRLMKIRMISFLNYNVFYYYDSGCDVVYIFRILYNHADWKNILKR